MLHRKSDHIPPLRPQHFIGHNNLDIVADVGGPESGLPVILLHGGGQTRHSWKKLALTLIQSGFRVTNVDLRGHGDSDWAEDGNYGIDAFVSDLKMLITHQLSPPLLVGASLGGITALLAVGESDVPLARGIALVDIVPKFEPEGSDAIARFMQSNPNGFASLDEAAATVAAYLPHRPRPSSNTGLMKNLRPGKDGRLYWHWDPRMFDISKDQRPDQVSERMEQAARRLRIPTLLVRGGKSDLVSLEGVKHFLDLVPGASFVDVQGAAHMVAGDMNDVFSQAIIDFIKDKLQG
jgi:non-heme chloroperoxidase